MIKEIKYLPFNKFVVRTPFLSFNQYESIFAKLNISALHFENIIHDKAILEAIYLGSPELYAEILKYLDNILPDKKQEDRLRHSVLRYITRMSTRCTPFGLFAACTVGSINENTDIMLCLSKDYVRHTRLDMTYLCALSQNIARLPNVKYSIKFFPNTSIYTYGKQIRYIEYKYKNSKRIHNIVSVENSAYVQKILERSKDGALMLELAELLVSEDITIEDSTLFISELIDSQLLINEIEPTITGQEYFFQLINILEKIPEIEFLTTKLKKINNLLNDIDNQLIGETQIYYEQIIEIIKELGTEFELKYLFQTDMIKPSIKSTISNEFINDIYEGLLMLNKLSPKYTSNTLLAKFAEAFTERYDGQSVQLLKVLDTELGIGYKQNSSYEGDINSLIDDIVTPTLPNSNFDIKWNAIKSILHQKFIKAYSERKTEIEITFKDFEKFDANWDNFPLTISVMCEVFSINEDKKIIYLHSAGGPSAANLLGRFCYADKELHKYVLSITQKEEELDPEVIYAEIVHLPESRIGNILLRPILRKYEIPYLAKSSVDKEFQLPLSDLFVSVKSGNIKLHSKALKKQVVPRLSTAHNYSIRSMPVYQFLCDLQTANLTNAVGFNWGNLSDEYTFLPRVNFKNKILSLARWKIKCDNIRAFFNTIDEVELLKQIFIWRTELQIPRYTVLVDGDNELFVDFDNLISIKTLLSLIKKRSSFILREFPFDPNSAIVKNSDGDVFTNEFIFAFYKSDLLEKKKYE